MATLPTDGGDYNAWGTELNTFLGVGHDTGGQTKDGVLRNVNGTQTLVYTKYFTGTLDSDTSTSVAHGVTNGLTKILAVTAMAYGTGASGFRFVEQYLAASALSQVHIQFDGTNVIFGSVGTQLQGQAYRIKIDYIL